MVVVRKVDHREQGGSHTAWGEGDVHRGLQGGGHNRRQVVAGSNQDGEEVLHMGHKAGSLHTEREREREGGERPALL